MSDDYSFPQHRKSKNDKKAKARYNKYKIGGHNRSTGVKITNTSTNK